MKTFKRDTSDDSNMPELVRGKVVYVPPERCEVGVYVEETPHGLKLYRNLGERHYMVLPWSAVKQIITKE